MKTQFKPEPVRVVAFNFDHNRVPRADLTLDLRRLLDEGYDPKLPVLGVPGVAAGLAALVEFARSRPTGHRCTLAVGGTCDLTAAALVADALADTLRHAGHEVVRDRAVGAAA